MKKKSLLGFLMILPLLLSSCTLIKKDTAVDAATEIIRLGERTVNKGTIVSSVNQQMYQMAQLYAQFNYSYDVTDPEVIADAQNTVINAYKRDLALRAKAEELGLDRLTEEEEAQAKADAEESFQSNLDQIRESEYADSTLGEEELKAEITEHMEKEHGYTMEIALNNARDVIVEGKVKDSVIKDVTVSDEEVEAEYNTRVETAKSNYEDDASSWCSAFNNGTSTLYYTPAGVRYAKQILIKFKDEDQAAMTAANGKVTAAQAILDAEDSTEEQKTQAEADKAAAQAELDAAKAAAFANIDADADAVLADLAGGADWDTLMAEKSQDPGMASGRKTAETGYAVCENMTSFDSAFVNGLFALEKVGDVSEKIASDLYGYYIIQYTGDAVEGPVALDSVKEDLHSSLLTTRQNTVYDDTVSGWVEAADFKLDLSALKD